MPRAMSHDGNGSKCSRRRLQLRVEDIVQSLQQRLVSFRVVHYVSQQQYLYARP